MTLRKLLVVGLALFAGFLASASRAAVISASTPTISVPAALYDPFTTLTSPLPTGQILLPIKITGANGLQDWSFDLAFDDTVVTPLDTGGLYQSVYQAEFNAADTTLSNITSSGFLGTGVLEGIAGFSSGVSGDGLLAFVLFEYLPGQNTNDPSFGIEHPAIAQSAPEPGTLVLLVAALAAAGVRRKADRKGAYKSVA